MGGSHIVTSEIVIIKPSEDPDIDVDYTFVQVGIDNNAVGYSGNCGNISAGVGPFAIDEGLVKERRSGVSIDPAVDTREVRIFNTGTNYTVCDVGNIIIFARAQDLGIPGNVEAADLDNDAGLIAHVKELRGKAA